MVGCVFVWVGSIGKKYIKDLLNIKFIKLL